MPRTTIAIPGDAVLNRVGLGRFFVTAWVRTSWGDSGENWQRADYLEAVNLVERGLHGRSQCTLAYNYGKIRRRDATDFAYWRPLGDRDMYVCLMVQPDVPVYAPFALWVGVIPAEQLNVYGTKFDDSGDPLPAGQQTLTAYGLEYLLERRELDGAAVVAPGQTEEGETEYAWLHDVPAFNERLPRGMQVAGNRSQYPINLPSPPDRPATYGFGNDRDGSNDPFLWTTRQVIDYLLFWSEHADNYPTDEKNDEPHFTLGGHYTALGALSLIYPQLRAQGRNVWSMLKELIDPRRGLGAYFAWPTIDGGDWDAFPDTTAPIELRVHTLTDTLINVGGGILPPLPGFQQVDLDIDTTDHGVDQAVVSIDSVTAYDQIVVQGARMRVCFSAAHYTSDPEPAGVAYDLNLAQLSPAWLPGDETAYENTDDAGRKRKRFERVFRRFRLGPALGGEDERFDWVTKGAEPIQLNPNVENPEYDQNGKLILGTAGPYGNLNNRLFPDLLLPAPEDVAAETVEQRFAKTSAVVEVYDAGAGAWSSQYCDVSNTPSPDDGVPDDRILPEQEVSADVTPQDRGLEIDVHFRQAAHAVGKNHFTPRTGDAESGTLTTLVDMDTAILTLGAEHEILVDDTVRVSWTGGSRSGMTVTAVDGTSVTVDGGTGDILPEESTAVTVTPNIDAPAVDPEFDYEKMIVTVCAESDNRPTVTAATAIHDQRHNRRKVIRLEDAHLWLVAPGTITGVNNNGSLAVYSGEKVIRDDTGRLRQVLALAKAWYGRDRAALTYTRRGILNDFDLGIFIRSALVNQGYQDIGSCVSERRWDFVRQTTTIRTGHLELDVTRL